MSRLTWTATTLALALASGVALTGCAPTGAQRRPAVVPEAAPSPADVPEAALLQPADFAVLPGAAGSGWGSPGPGSNPGWLFAIPHCPAYRAADYPARAKVIAARDWVYAPSAQRMVIQVVERYAPGWAGHGVEDVRRVVAACGRYEYRSGSAGFTERLTVRQAGFAAEDSLLVESVQTSLAGKSYQRHLAVVRRGDLVATIAAGGLAAGEVRALAERAAGRMQPVP